MYLNEEQKQVLDTILAFAVPLLLATTLDVDGDDLHGLVFLLDEKKRAAVLEGRRTVRMLTDDPKALKDLIAAFYAADGAIQLTERTQRDPSRPEPSPIPNPVGP